jgi:uncharacterized protein YdeI (YjbR/CyaY-like superfamily)
MGDGRASPRFFRSPAEWRGWLERHHESRTEILVGFHKKHTSRPSLTWSESVEQAICFGWIDGVRKSRGRRLAHLIEVSAKKRRLDALARRPT